MADDKDKTAGEKAAAEGAATSVAEAVKRVADAAVAAVQKVEPAAKTDFRFTGRQGGAFTITGDGFGAGGTVKVNGVQAKVTAWGDEHIEGTLANAVSGNANVEVIIDDKTIQRGTFAL